MTSNPTKYDSDGDGINDVNDTEPLYEGLKGGIIGELTIISSKYNGFGHAYLVYKSYINDTLDFTHFYAGYKLGSPWTREGPKVYKIKSDEKVTLSCSGDGNLGKIKQAFNGGVYYNREVKKAFKKDDLTKYKKNVYISNDVNQEQLNSMISSLNNNNWYNVYTHNCAKVARIVWNNTFKGSHNLIPKVASNNNNDKKGDAISPYVLCDAISYMNGYKKEYNLDYEFEFVN